MRNATKSQKSQQGLMAPKKAIIKREVRKKHHRMTKRKYTKRTNTAQNEVCKALLIKVVRKAILNHTKTPNTNGTEAVGRKIVGNDNHHYREFGGRATARYQCKFCSQTFDAWGQVQIHEACITGNFNCAACGSKCQSITKYEKHVLAKHMSHKKIACTKCPAKFNKEFYWGRHLQQKHGIQGGSVKKSSKLVAKVGTGIQRSNLPKAGSETANRINPAGLIPDHRQQTKTKMITWRPYACDFEGCDKVYSRRGYLLRHKLSHSEPRPYHCGVCGSGFKFDDTLKLHFIREHTDPTKPSCAPIRLWRSKRTGEFRPLQQDIHGNQLIRQSGHDEDNSDASEEYIDVVEVLEDEEELTTEEMNTTSSENGSASPDRDLNVGDHGPPMGIDKPKVTSETEKMEIFLTCFSKQGLTELKSVLSPKIPKYPF